MDRKIIFATALFVVGQVALACSTQNVPPSTTNPPSSVDDANPATKVLSLRERLHALAMSPKPIVPDTRTTQQIAQAACVGGRCVGAMVKPISAAGGSSPIIPPSWTVPNWWVDDANSTTCASDTNSGTSATCTGGCTGAKCPSGIGPLATYQELAIHRWGTYQPRLRQNTTLTFLSSQTNNTDPVILNPGPITENESTLTLQGPLGAGQLVMTGTITLVHAKNRATPQLLNVTFSGAATLASGMLVQNTMHSSLAFLYTNTAGRTWNMTQPLVPQTPPLWSGGASEVNTWVTGDTVNVYSPVTIDLESAIGNIGDYGVGNDPPTSIVIYHLTGLDPGGLVFSIAYANQTVFSNTEFFESTSQRLLVGQLNQLAYSGFYNSFLSGLYLPGPANTGTGVLGAGGSINPIPIYGGGLGQFGLAVSLTGGNTGYDAILSEAQGGFQDISLNGGQLGNTYVDTSTILHTLGQVNIGQNQESSEIVWGPGTLDTAGQGRLNYPGGGGVASGVLLTTLTANSQTKTCIGVPSVASPTLTCNVTLNKANLDANLGGTSGCLFVEGGGSWCNF